jgi:hypothetical protein
MDLWHYGQSAQVRSAYEAQHFPHPAVLALTRIAGGVAFTAFLAFGLALSGPATADIYWANETGSSIGRAHNDGSSETPNFVTGATAPGSVAVGGGYVYWSHGGAAPATGKIGRARLDSPGSPDQAFVSMTGTAPASESSPSGVAVDGGHVYWTQVFSSGCSTPPCGKVGRATLDGSTVEQQFIQPFFSSIGATPCGLAVEPDHLYWTNSGADAIGRAHGPFDVDSDIFTGASNPCGMAFADGTAFWANRGNNTIGRAKVATGDVNQSFIDTGAGNVPCGVAADANYVYWTTANGKVWRWRLDGSRGNAIESLVTDAVGPCGIAVDPTASASPLAHTYGATTVGQEGDVQAFAIENTSSSVLDVSSVTLLGDNPGDFRLTGDGCTVGGTASGGLCILNVQFAPTAPGARAATLRVASNATDSPIDISLSGEATVPAGPAPPADGSTPLPPQVLFDNTAPVVKLAAAPKQSIGSGFVVITNRANEAGVDTATGSVAVSGGSSAAKSYALNSVTVGHAANVTVKLKLKIPKKTRAALRRALDAGRKLKASIKLRSTDTAGNSTTKRKTVRLKR